MKRVVEKNGRLLINVDGKEVMPIAYTSYLPHYASYNKFKDIDYNLFSAVLYMGDKPLHGFSGIKKLEEGIWKARDVYDFSIADRILNVALGDSDAYVLLRLNVNTPSWWLEENPDDCTLMEDGTTPYQSVFSDKWIEDVRTYLTKLKAYIAQSRFAKNVIGWQIAAMNTEEWLAPVWNGNESDFSVCAHEYFRTWCKNKYATIENLCDSWSRHYLDFEEILVPKLKERKERLKNDIIDTKKYAYVNDWYYCLNERYATALHSLAKFTKELFNGDILVGCFYGYIGQCTLDTGHTCIESLIDSPYIDFFASPFSYVDGRKSATDWFYHSGMQTCANNGKIWFLEADVRTHKTKLLCDVDTKYVDKNNEYMEMPCWHPLKTEDESVWHTIKAFSKILCSANAFWWFDMWGGWYDSQRLLDLLARMKDEYIQEMSKPYASESEIAVILDSQSSFAVSNSYFKKVVYDELCQLGFVGAPYDLYLKSCVTDNQLKDYKLVIYPAPNELNSRDLEVICSLSNHNKIVLIGGKQFDISHKNVYNEPCLVNTQALKSYCEKANVHTYVKNNAVIYKSERHICITAPNEGEYELNFPHECALTSFTSGKKVLTKDKKLKIALKEMQSELLLIEKI